MEIIDLEKYRLPPGMSAPAKPKKKPPRQWRGEFLRGPIPWPWLTAAMALPGRALAVGLVLWRQAGCRKAMTFALTLAKLAECGIHRDTGRRALRALERASLIALRRQPGRAIEVTILLPAAPMNMAP
jgi:hypothetical protein